MARGSRQSRRSAISSIPNSIATTVLRPTYVPRALALPTLGAFRDGSSGYPDRRERVFARARPQLSFNPAATRLNPDAFGRAVRSSLTAGLRFAIPEQVGICHRRKSRREVLFALRRTGRGAGAKRRTRTRYSNISCR